MGCLTTEELERLRIFQKRFDDMKRSTLLERKNISISVNLDLGNPFGEGSGIDGYDKDELRSFLLILRQFMMASESVFVYAVHNVIHRKCIIRSGKEWAEYAREKWKKSLLGAPLGLKIGSQVYNTERAFDLFINGELFHSDSEKIDQLETMSGNSRVTLEFFVHHAIPDLVNSLFIYSEILRVWLDEPQNELPEPPY